VNAATIYASKGRSISPPEYSPIPPRRINEIDIPENMLIDLAMRHISHQGTVTIHLLAHLMKIPLELAEAIFRNLSESLCVEVKRMLGEDYVFSLSPSGRKMAAERALSSRYTGPAPVSLKAWTAAVQAQRVKATGVTRQSLERAFAGIVIPGKLMDALGPALISGGAIFLYGPSGTGKTTISERLMRVHDDTVVVPYAVEVDGQVVMLADPAIHEPVVFPEEVQKQLDIDPRWVICRRPFVAVGGELVTGMLDLQKDEASGAFSAPLQMKANNGMLLIDDFGRQMMSPRDLLNRWIVPLDRRVDFLSVGSGGKIDIPFELQVVFSTNLAPQELADEAFLRRIPNKILVDAADVEAFDAIFKLTAAGLGMEYEADSAESLRELCLRHSPDLRPCFPRDICKAIRAITTYEERLPRITRADLERAVAGYFV
jgi:predicted ATPase with chaperone activity